MMLFVSLVNTFVHAVGNLARNCIQQPALLRSSEMVMQEQTIVRSQYTEGRGCVICTNHWQERWCLLRLDKARAMSSTVPP